MTDANQREELERLAGLCEAATGADRKIDAEIAARIDLPDSGYTWVGQGGGSPLPPRYTASLDDAMTLLRPLPTHIVAQIICRVASAVEMGGITLDDMARTMTGLALRALAHPQPSKGSACE